MTSITNKQIKEIAEQLDSGFRCFQNKVTGELIFIPDMLKHAEMDTDAWSEEMEELDRNFNKYHEIYAPDSSDSFRIMEEFVYSLNDLKELKSRLIEALNKKKPFREFKSVIDNSGEYRQIWFDFKNQELQKLVQEQLQNMQG